MAFASLALNWPVLRQSHRMETRLRSALLRRVRAANVIPATTVIRNREMADAGVGHFDRTKR
jgi:hypothetical protein